MNKVIEYLKAHKLGAAIVIVIIAIIAYYGHKKTTATSASVKYVTAAVQKETIVSSVDGSGQVSEENKVDIKPSVSGQLVSVNVVAGQSLKAGQTIAVVDQRNAAAALAQAKASLASAKANYDKVAQGSTSTDIQLAQLAVDSAQNALDKAQSDYQTTVKEQQRAVSNAHITFLNNDLSAVGAVTNISTATITLSGSYNSETEGQYVITVGQNGLGYSYDISGMEMADGTITRGVAIPLGKRGLYFTVSTTGNLNIGDTWTVNIPNTASSTYFSANNTYQNALQTQSDDLAAAQNTIKTAQNNLQQAQVQLQVKQQPPLTADLEVAEAQVQNAEAALTSAEINYSNTIIAAPFDGVISAVDQQKGDQASSGTVLATLITHEQMAQLSMNEVDVAKIKVGDKANLTFDAIDGLNLTGTVAQIDVVGTVTQGVATYNVKIGFDSQDPRIKPGMTVNASVITDVATDALGVPSSAVKTDSSGNTYVQTLDAQGQPQNHNVTVGISSDTDTQITSGLNEGDEIVAQTINTSAAKTTTSSSSLKLPGLGGGNGFGGNAGFRAGGGTTVRVGGGG